MSERAAAAATPYLSRSRKALVCGLVLFSIYLALGIVYASRSHELASRQNLWFGTDIPLFVDWVATFRHRQFFMQWHPESALMFKLYGLVLRRIAGLPPTLLWAGIPVMAGTAAALAFAAWVFEVKAVGTAVAAAVLLGPTLVFAPVPENHMLGGAWLLAQGALLHHALILQEGQENAPRVRKAFIASTAFGCLAGGFTATNYVPAFFMACAGASLWKKHLRLGLLTVGLCALPGVALVAALALWSPGAPREWLHDASEYLSAPSLSTLWQSVRNLAVAQFGVPPVSLQAGSPACDDNASCIVLSGAASPWSIAAGVLWLISLFASFRRAGPATRRWLGACCASLTLLVLWHAVYDTSEAYLFSPAAWPYLVLPLWLALSEGRQNRVAVTSAGGVVALSAVQAAFGLQAVWRLLPST